RGRGRDAAGERAGPARVPPPAASSRARRGRPGTSPAQPAAARRRRWRSRAPRRQVPPPLRFLQLGAPFGKKGRMPIRSRKARRATIREVLDSAIELEKRTMALYVAFVQAFPRPEEVRNFWFSMARHEAGHCGALALVEAIVDSDPSRAHATRVWFDEHTVARLRGLLTAYLREVRAGDVSVER